MAKEMSGESRGEKGPSLKDEIINRIRLEEERERQAGVATATGPRPTSKDRPAPMFRSRLFGPNMRAMAIYCRQLATLIDVGIPLLRLLQILGQRSAHRKLKRVSADLARRVEEGQPLSTAMSYHPNVFSPMFVGIVRTGETGGILDESLRRLADILERRANLRRRVLAAMTYPLIAFFVELIIIGIILIYAMPKLLAAYPKPEMLPKATQALLRASTFAQTYWIIALIVFVIIVVAVYAILQMAAGRIVFERTMLHLPIFGGITRKLNVARFTRTLGNLTAAGVPLVDALAITADTSENTVVRRTLRHVHATVERGGKMEEPMRREPIFDEMVVDMIMVGDEAGTLDMMLLKVADSYDSDVEASLRTLTSILEPLLIICLGVAVAFLAIAVFLPYVGLVRNPNLMVE